jgi:hypothetical protein
MRLDEDALVAAAARRCGDALVVPVVRVDVSCMEACTYAASAALVGVLVSRPGGALGWVPVAAEPEGTTSWQAWLVERPRLLAELRARLEAAARARLD